jgi:hypothetical protein
LSVSGGVSLLVNNPLVNVTPRVSGPECVCALVDRLLLLHAGQHGFVREASPEIVLLDRHAVDAADVRAGLASRFEKGEALVEFLKRHEAFFDAADTHFCASSWVAQVRGLSLAARPPDRGLYGTFVRRLATISSRHPTHRSNCATDTSVAGGSFEDMSPGSLS